MLQHLNVCPVVRGPKLNTVFGAPCRGLATAALSCFRITCALNFALLLGLLWPNRDPSPRHTGGWSQVLPGGALRFPGMPLGASRPQLSSATERGRGDGLVGGDCL